jgi:outer membrane usher protein
VSRRFSVRGGVDYSRFSGSFGGSRGLGVNVALVFQPDYSQRAEARYGSSTASSTLSYTNASSSRIGSVGYGAVVGRDLGAINAQGYADYIGNRFDAGISHASYGSSVSRFGESNVTSLRVGTSIAFADGAFGIGRRINDSFAILYPHENLNGHAVVAGQSLIKNDYISKSGALGGAVNGFLTSCTVQSVQYDVENPPPGYDIGAGVVRVKPPYHGGYKLRVGTDAFVSAFGTLAGADGKPSSLASGQVTATDGKDRTPIPFFTNSVGRFAVQNLRPGVDYQVVLFNSANRFTIRVPADTTGLVDLKTVTLRRAE